MFFRGEYMNKLLHLFNGILLSNKKEQIIDTLHILDEFLKYMLSEGSQSYKVIYHMICLHDLKKMENHSDGEEINDFQWLEVGGECAYEGGAGGIVLR